MTPTDRADQHRVATASKHLEFWLDAEEYKGWDPHDALNSPLIKTLTFRNRFLGIVALQFIKRCPINSRPLLGIRKEYNPKGMGLFLSAYVQKYRMTEDPRDLERARYFAEWLIAHSLEGYAGASWGYNFDWPSRWAFVPKYTPNIVTTSYVANAFLDLYDLLGHRKYLEIARSSSDFILNDLNIYRKDAHSICFSYTPVDHSRIHNASLWGAELLARIAKHIEGNYLRDFARQAVNFVIEAQQSDGSWYYGENANQKWIDSYHTGFILEALNDYITYSNDYELLDPLKKGFEYFCDHLVLPDGRVKFRSTGVYPIDIHCQAQGIITFVKLKEMDLHNIERAQQIAQWTIQHMQDPEGGFYYQKHRFFTNHISYMRWCNAWMARALLLLLLTLLDKGNT